MNPVKPIDSSVSNFDQLPGSALIRLHVLLVLFSCSRATLWRWVKSGKIPAPKKLGARMAVWTVSEVRQALNDVCAS